MVSVIVPAFNAKATLAHTIDSVQRQTFEDFELIVIDDGSTDGTPEWLRNINDDRLRCSAIGMAVLRWRETVGSREREESSSRSSTRTIYGRPTSWQCSSGPPPATEAALAYSWTALVDQHGDFLFPKEASRYEGDVYAELLKHCFVANGSNILVRTSCALDVGGFNTALPRAGDWDFCLRVASRWPFAVVPCYQIFYRISERAMTADAQSVRRSHAAHLRSRIRGPTPTAP